MEGGDTAVFSPPPPPPTPTRNQPGRRWWSGPGLQKVPSHRGICCWEAQLGLLHCMHTQPRERPNNTPSPRKSIVRLISLVTIKHSDARRVEHKALLNSRAEQSQECFAFVYIRYSADSIPLGNSNGYGYSRVFTTTSARCSNTDHTSKSNLRNVWSVGNLTLSHL